jgi:PAS domain S-box-containing protein
VVSGPHHRGLVLLALLAAGGSAAAPPAPDELPLTGAQREWLRAHPVIRVGMDPDYPPYEWVDAQGRRVGMSVDLLRLLEPVLGVRFEVVAAASWPEALALAREGKVDLLTSVVATPGRDTYLTFTAPYRDLQTVIIDDGRGGFLGSLRNLEGKRVAVERGYYTQELLTRDHPGITLVPVGSAREALALVADGRADAYVGDVAGANHAMKRHGLGGLRFSGQTDYRVQHRFGVTRSAAPLAAILDLGLASLPRTELDAVFDRWLDLGSEPGVPTRSLALAASALALLGVVAAWRFRRLRVEVREREASELRERARSQALEQLGEERRRSEALYRLLTEDALDVAWKTDAQLRLTYISPVDERLRGYRADEVLGHHVFELFDQEGVEEVKGLLHRRAQALDDSGFVAFEVRHRCKDGRLLWAEVHSKPERDAGGTIIGYHGITRETTERHQLQEARAVNARLSAMATLVAGVAHETNNPLAAVISAQDFVADEVTRLADALRARAPLDREAAVRQAQDCLEALADASQASQRIARIVKDLARFGASSTPRQRVGLREVVARALQALPASVRGGAAIRLEGGDAPEVVASEADLGQLVANLVTNAVQSLPGGSSGTVTVSVGPGSGGMVRLAVHDDGAGIAPEVMARMFDPFFSTRGVGQGMGLGLPVAHAIARAHGGTLTCTSAPGAGATFEVLLPRAAPSATA